MVAQRERQYDELEKMAESAMMNRQAYHAKRLKASHLFKRPVDDETAKKRLDGVEERMKNRMERLSKFKKFQGKLKTDRKEAINE